MSLACLAPLALVPLLLWSTLTSTIIPTFSSDTQLVAPGAMQMHLYLLLHYYLHFYLNLNLLKLLHMYPSFTFTRSHVCQCPSCSHTWPGALLPDGPVPNCQGGDGPLHRIGGQLIFPSQWPQ